MTACYGCAADEDTTKLFLSFNSKNDIFETRLNYDEDEDFFAVNFITDYDFKPTEKANKEA